MSHKGCKKGITYYIFQVIALIGIATTVAFLLYVIWQSAASKDGFTAKHYMELMLGTPEYWVFFWNSFKISILILLGTLASALIGAFVLYRYRFRGSNLLFGLLAVLMLMPYQVLMLPQLLMIHKFQLFNHLAGVILPNIFSSFGIVLLLQYMKKIPYESVEAAQVDGAGDIVIFRKVVFPQIKEGVITLAILNLVDTWNLVEQPQNILTDSRLYPLSISFSKYETSSMEALSAGNLIFLIPIVLLFFMGKDYLVEGISNTVVKK